MYNGRTACGDPLRTATTACKRGWARHRSGRSAHNNYRDRDYRDRDYRDRSGSGSSSCGSDEGSDYDSDSLIGGTAEDLREALRQSLELRQVWTVRRNKKGKKKRSLQIVNDRRDATPVTKEGFPGRAGSDLGPARKGSVSRADGGGGPVGPGRTPPS